MTPAPTLAGQCVVVTRPAQQSAALIAAIERAGGSALAFPLLAIDAADPAPLEALAARLTNYRFAVFVSQNAVAQALPVLLRERAWPAQVQAVTMGPASRAALQRGGLGDVILPAGPFDSETLLQHPALQADAVRGARVVILRGDGGRDVLARGLTARGAQVDFVQCYTRRAAKLDPAPLLAALRAARVSAITLTSSEALSMLMSTLGAAFSLAAAVPMFVPHDRIARAAREAGWRNVVLTAAGDVGLLAGMEQYFAKRPV